MGARFSLLRPRITPPVCVAVLALTAGAAGARAAAPDPSPSAGYRPDPAPAQAAPLAPVAPSHRVAPPSTVVHHTVTRPKAPTPIRRTAPPARLRRTPAVGTTLQFPHHVAPRFVAFADRALESSRRVPLQLAAALAALLVLSALVVAGAARTVAPR